MRAVCRVQLKHVKRGKKFMLGSNDTIDQLVNRDHWYSHVVKREDSHVLRRTFEFDVESLRDKWRLKRT